jgi:hypothetical protein
MSRSAILIALMVWVAGCELFAPEPTPQEQALKLFNQGRQL